MSLIEEVRTVRQRIAARLRELEPLVREYEELRRAAEEMGIDDAEIARAASAPEGAGSPRPASTRAPGRTSRRRMAGAGAKLAPAPEESSEDLADAVLSAVVEKPGQTVAEYARTLGVQPTAIYRPVRELSTAGRIVKRARLLYPT
jgi:DNA-binding NtrC family response regulator